MTYPSFGAKFIVVIEALLIYSLACNWIILILISCYRAI